MDLKIKRKIERAFYNYTKLVEDCVLSTVEWAESNMAIDYSKVNVKSSPGKGRETKLCETIDKSQEALKWCYVVEKVLDCYKWDSKEQVIRKHYFERKTIEITSQEIHCSRRTCNYWIEEIILKAYMWAIDMRLIREEIT